jgi:hypothetical protein
VAKPVNLSQPWLWVEAISAPQTVLKRRYQNWHVIVDLFVGFVAAKAKSYF